MIRRIYLPPKINVKLLLFSAIMTNIMSIDVIPGELFAELILKLSADIGKREVADPAAAIAYQMTMRVNRPVIAVRKAFFGYQLYFVVFAELAQVAVYCSQGNIRHFGFCDVINFLRSQVTVRVLYNAEDKYSLLGH